MPTTALETSSGFLQVTGLRKEYVTLQGERVRAIEQTDLSVPDAEFVSVVGPSGCGKTTLLKIIAGLVPCTEGEVRLGSMQITGPHEGLGVVFQSPVLLPWLPVLENVLLPIRVHRKNPAEFSKRANELLAMVGLDGFQRKYPRELSGGMQQRVAIVRSLIHNPSLLLMDEPFGALDALTRDRMALELQRIWLANRKTVFFITHSITEAIFLSDRVLVMSSRPGRIIREFRIPFPRPRALDIMASPHFGQLEVEIRRLLGGDVP